MGISSKQKKYILVTGGAGAIGSYLVNTLCLTKKYKIDVIDNLDSGHRDNLIKNSKVKFFKGSILNKKFLKKFKNRGYTHIYHLAACFANQNSIEHPKKDLRVNIEGTLNMLQVARSQSTLKKFVYFSSSCIYGAKNTPMSETDIPNPDTPYAISKLAGEHYTNFFNHFYNLPTNNLRLFNIYGSNERSGRYRNVIPNFINSALNSQSLCITGDGSDTRDFTYIDDAISYILAIAEDSETSGETFNIGSGSPVAIVDLAEAVLKSTGNKTTIEYTSRRTWDTINNRLAETSKLRKYLLKKRLNKVKEFIKKTQKDGSIQR